MSNVFLKILFYVILFSEEVYVAHFVVRDASNAVVCAVDLPHLSAARLTYLMSAAQLAIFAPRGEQVAILALDIDLHMTVQQECTIMAGILSEKISSSDMLAVQNSMVLTLREIVKGEL